MSSDRFEATMVLERPAPSRLPAASTIELRFDRVPAVDNRWKYPEEAVADLRALLYAGTPARPDPARAGIYEVERDGSVFYIHISPVSRNVMLLAMWRA